MADSAEQKPFRFVGIQDNEKKFSGRNLFGKVFQCSGK